MNLFDSEISIRNYVQFTNINSRFSCLLFADRGPNRGRYGNFGEDGGSRGGFERNGREGSYGGQGRDDRGGNDRYGNYNRRGGGNNDRRPPPREFNDKPAGPVIGEWRAVQLSLGDRAPVLMNFPSIPVYR